MILVPEEAHGPEDHIMREYLSIQCFSINDAVTCSAANSELEKS